MNATTSQATNREDCERECFNDRECKAASFTDRSGSPRCLMYYGESYPVMDSDSVYWKASCGPGICLRKREGKHMMLFLFRTAKTHLVFQK